MGCACGKRAGARGRSGPGTEYTVTLPDGTVKGPYLSPIEARREVRAAGGGTIKASAPSADTES